MPVSSAHWNTYWKKNYVTSIRILITKSTCFQLTSLEDVSLSVGPEEHEEGGPAVEGEEEKATTEGDWQQPPGRVQWTVVPGEGVARGYPVLLEP